MRHHIVCVAVTWVSGGKGVWGGKGKICITQVIDSNSKGMMAKWDRPKDKTSATPGTSYMLPVMVKQHNNNHADDTSDACLTCCT
jgi:hypothetical protein